MKFLRDYGWALYLGTALAVFAKCSWLDLSWWAIVVPMIILERISREMEIKKIKKDNKLNDDNNFYGG